MLTLERRQELLKDTEIQQLVEFYSQYSVISAISIAANIADENRGMLQVGDMIRKQFGLPIQEKK